MQSKTTKSAAKYVEHHDEDRYGVYTARDRGASGPAVANDLPQPPMMPWALAAYLYSDTKALWEKADAESRDADRCGGHDAVREFLQETEHLVRWQSVDTIPLVDRLRILRDECDTWLDLLESDAPSLQRQRSQLADLGCSEDEVGPLARRHYDDAMRDCWRAAAQGLRTVAKLASEFRI
jgi:hypothetical protein